MADIAFGSVLNVIKLALKIQKQVKTVRQNDEERRDIEQEVGTLIEILSPLQQNPGVVMTQPGINASLLSLEMSLNRALNLIKDCQESNAMRRLFGAGDMSRRLSRIRTEILQKMVMLVVATSAFQVTISMTNTIQLQYAGLAEIAHTNHFTAHDARSRVSNEITMLETGSKILHAPSSRLTTLSLSESEATIHHSSKQSVSVGGGHSVRMMQQIVIISISLPSPKMRKQARSLCAMAGVERVGIIGDGDQLLVIGEGLDAVCLLRCLRKKLGHADMIPVVAARDMNKPEDHKVGARKSNKGWTMAFQATWRQLCRRNKAGTTTAAEKGQGRVSFVGARGRSRSTMDDIAEQAAVLPMLPSGPSSSLPSIRQETPMLSRRRTTATTPSMTASRSVTSSAARTGMAHGNGKGKQPLLCEDNDDSDSHHDNSDEDSAYELRMSQMLGAPLYSQSQTTPGAGPSTSMHEPKTPVKTMQGSCLVQPRKWVTVMNRLPVLSVNEGIITAICLVGLIVFSLFITSLG